MFSNIAKQVNGGLTHQTEMAVVKFNNIIRHACGGTCGGKVDTSVKPIKLTPTDPILCGSNPVPEPDQLPYCFSLKDANMTLCDECTPERFRRRTWYGPPCCVGPCSDSPERTDDKYYRITPKDKRAYKQTWTECPELKILPKKICCFERGKEPPLERRPRKERPPTACPPVRQKCGPDDPCKKIKMPNCCKDARDPPCCKKITPKQACKKLCVPFPCFSECIKPFPKPLPPSECRCMDGVDYCTLLHMKIKKW